MKRIIIICEGQTEQAFVKTNLQVPFINRDIILHTPLIKPSRGGIVKWSKLKGQIETHLKVEPEAYITTFIDYYGLYSKHAFPEWENAHTIVDKNKRMDFLELSMYNDIDERHRYRFIPNLQLHEFEGLLFNDIEIFLSLIPQNDLIGVEELKRTFNDFPNPEMINNERKTSPSHRLMRIIKGYNKVIYGDIIAEAIGLERIRTKAHRFNNWITNLENI